jgi:serine/threonine-protein kinase
MYKFDYDHTEKRLTMALEEANKALELDPNLAEANWAIGYYYYWGYRDCDRAQRYFEIARRSQPNNSRFISAISYAQKWQGKFDQALVNIKKAYDLDPLSHTLATEVGLVYLLMRKYPEAERYCERAIQLAPDYNMAYEWKARLYLRWQGSIEKARAVIEEALQNVRSEDQSRISYLLIDIDVYDENYQGALNRLDSMLEDVNDIGVSDALLYAKIYGCMNNREMEQKYYNKARVILEPKVEEQPERSDLHRLLGIAYAGLGLKEDAIREAERAVELVPVRKQPWRGTFPIEDLARIYTMVGKRDSAIDQIESLLDAPGRMSISMLRLDPVWEPLRNHPRLKKRIEAGK